MSEWALSQSEAAGWMKRRTIQELRDWRSMCERILNPVHLCEYPQERAVEIKETYKKRIAAIDAELASREQGGTV